MLAATPEDAPRYGDRPEREWLAERVMPQAAHTGTVDHVEFSAAERAWLQSGFRKVTVKEGSQEKLRQRGALARVSGDHGFLRPARLRAG